MKRILTIAAVIAVAAVPATSGAAAAGAAAGAAGNVLSRGGQDLSIRFVLRTLNGKPVRVREFRFSHLTATCNGGGTVDVRGKIHRMKVNDAGKFDGNAKQGDGKVHVEGDSNSSGSKVTGTIRARGKFDSLAGCDSGNVRWKAT